MGKLAVGSRRTPKLCPVSSSRVADSAGEPRRRGRPANPTAKAARRRAIVQAAYAVLTERGYDRTSMSDIARQANVGQGTLYRHYASKRVLLDDVFDYAVAKVMRALRPRSLTRLDLTDYRQALELITVFGTRMFALVDDDPNIVRLITVESSAIDSELRYRVNGLFSALDVMLTQLFETANPDRATEINRPAWALLGRMVLGLAGPGLLMSVQGNTSTASRTAFLASIAAIADHGLLTDESAEETVGNA